MDIGCDKEDGDLLACVICGESTDPAAVCGAMLAWWQRRDAGVGAPFFKAGLYHHGSMRDGRCWRIAEKAGYLSDVHAEDAVGRFAVPMMTRILSTYPADRWEPKALHRLAMIVCRLATVKARAR